MIPLLCESCGYPVDGLSIAGNCPECGRPISSSLPEARTGSAWQRRRSVRAWIATNWRTLRHPREQFTRVRVETRSGVWLAAVNLLCAAIVIIAPWTGVLHDDPITLARRGNFARLLSTAALVIPLQVIAAAGILLALTLLEWAGIRFWSARRGRRLTAAAAWQVCAHATVGWIIAGAGVWLMLIVYLNLSYFGLSRAIESIPAYGATLMIGLCALGFALGLLAFECLVYIGVERCRFANAPRSPADGAIRATMGGPREDGTSSGLEAERVGAGGNPAGA